ncbi:MAG: hypothetical protein Q4G23_03890 [Clostridia bacterium]|nr:hypothetical protein [Clostridia bacterium]
MKKFLGLLMAFVLCFSFVTTFAMVPDELREALTGQKYNLSCSGKIEFEDAEFKSLVDFIREIAGDEIKELEYFVDFELLLESIFTSGAEFNMKADVSEDMKKIDAYIELRTDTNVNPNKNIETNTKIKTGIWIKYDVSGEKPCYRMIMDGPIFNKYAVIDIFGMMGVEDAKEFADLYTQYGKAYSAEYTEKITTATLDIIGKYAEITNSGRKYTIKIDNEGFCDMMRELVFCAMDIMVENNPEAFHEDPEVAKATVEIAKQMVPSFSGMKFIGEKGIVMEYTVSKGNIIKAKEENHIKIDIPSCAAAIGAGWSFESKPVIEFTLKAETSYTDYGKTKVEFPVLTEENSFDLIALLAAEWESAVEEEYVPEYPLWYFDIETDNIVNEESEIYVPLRTTLESAYEGNIELSYENGVITVTSPYFTEYDKMVFTVGSGEIKLGDETVNTDAVMMKDGVTYISRNALGVILRLELIDAKYDLLTGMYYITFMED